MNTEANRARSAYDEWHRERGGEQPDANEPWHMLAKAHIGDVEGVRVLEVGSGRGSFARYLAEQGAIVTASDFSPEAVTIAKETLAPFLNANAIIADAQNLPFSDESFDVVISLETMEHLPSPGRGFAEVTRVTKVGGRLIITTPNYVSPLGLYRLALKLTGRQFRETNQPINQPLTIWGRLLRLRRLGCRVTAVDGSVMNMPIPRYKTIYLPFDRFRAMRWFCTHVLTHAVRER